MSCKHQYDVSPRVCDAIRRLSLSPNTQELTSIAFSDSDYTLIIPPCVVNSLVITTLCHANVNTTYLRDSLFRHQRNSFVGRHVVVSAGCTGCPLKWSLTELDFSVLKKRLWDISS